MRPGRLTLRIVGAIALLSLSIPFVPSMIWVVAAGLLVLGAAAAMEAVWLRSVRFTLDRQQALALYLDEVETVPMRLITTASNELTIWFRQVWPDLLDAVTFESTASIRPGEQMVVEPTVRGIARGRAVLPPAALSVSRWELVERIVDVGTATEISVIPNLRAVQRWHRKINDFFLRGHGYRVAAVRGKGRELDRLRDWVEGDELRDVAWKATARHGRMIVREYRLERSQNIVVCLDKGHRMAERVGYLSRMDHAINTILLLAYTANRTEDKVGLVSFSARVERTIAPARGSAQMRRISDFLTEMEAGISHTDYPALAWDLRRTLKNRSLVLIFTMLPHMEIGDELLESVSVLSRRHLPMIVVQKDPRIETLVELLPENRRELSRFLVADDLLDQRRTLIANLQARGAIVVDSEAGDLATETINAYLDVKRRQLL